VLKQYGEHTASFNQSLSRATPISALLFSRKKRTFAPENAKKQKKKQRKVPEPLKKQKRKGLSVQYLNAQTNNTPPIIPTQHDSIIPTTWIGTGRTDFFFLNDIFFDNFW
jgi:hypothetical protein